MKGLIYSHYIFRWFFTSLFVFGLISKIQSQNHDYNRLYDSADVYVISKPKLASQFLDSIPIEAKDFNIKSLKRYYAIRARIDYQQHNFTSAYKNWVSSYNSATSQNDLDFAIYSSINLFDVLIEINKEDEALHYIKKAEEFSIKLKDNNRLMMVRQIPAFSKFKLENWAKCTEILEKDLEDYKHLEDKYLYAYALHMLTISHLSLGNYQQAYDYFNQYDAISDQNQVTTDTYYKASQHFYLSKYFNNKNQVDSSIAHIQNLYKLKPSLDFELKKKLYEHSVDVYQKADNLELKTAYQDSLLALVSEMSTKNLNEGFKLNDSLLKTQSELEVTTKKKRQNLILALTILTISLILGLLFFKNFRKIKGKLSVFKNKISELSYLKHNQDKLNAKVHGLEEYIKNLKQDIKSISNIREVTEQREKIKELYKNLHLDSYNVLKDGENHLGLINELNVDFFKQLNEKYPELNESESIICYYLSMGFKNKEIAFFLNTSIRSIESKRYRITKKMNLVKADVTLIEKLESLNNS
ncbi:helix-turn-helix transcriptional regulator [Olleya aquimaris]|uniref:Regulatory LuxR family protein n=1 Tax=Olleya aquimaris TaxID=639310 RepID=A0A327RM68_9FLAO|nr:LuxR C-terminal-related transcriptional regulator [Olleya aquimaris]RAJ18106.1 regulatory LuxR family protein [Olleya aquimaris]